MDEASKLTRGHIRRHPRLWDKHRTHEANSARLQDFFLIPSSVSPSLTYQDKLNQSRFRPVDTIEKIERKKKGQLRRAPLLAAPRARCGSSFFQGGAGRIPEGTYSRADGSSKQRVVVAANRSLVYKVLGMTRVGVTVWVLLRNKKRETSSGCTTSYPQVFLSSRSHGSQWEWRRSQPVNFSTNAVLSPGTITALPPLASISSSRLPYRRFHVFVKIDRMPCRNFEKGINIPSLNESVQRRRTAEGM